MAEKEVKGIKKFFEEFKAFAMRGNVLDMAVGVVIGGAFTAIVNSLVNDIINPSIGLFFNADFSDVGIHVGDVMIGIGSFINAIINFPQSPPPRCAPTARARSPSRRCAAPTAPASWRASRRSTIKF